MTLPTRFLRSSVLAALALLSGCTDLGDARDQGDACQQLEAHLQACFGPAVGVEWCDEGTAHTLLGLTCEELEGHGGKEDGNLCAQAPQLPWCSDGSLPAFEIDRACVDGLRLGALTYADDGTPFASREALDQVEWRRAVAALPELASYGDPVTGLGPMAKSADDYRAISDIRERGWATACGAPVRTLELVVTDSAIAAIEADPAAWGGDPLSVFNAYVAELNRMNLDSPDPLERVWVLDRVMVVADALVTGSQGKCNEAGTGWVVCNDPSFGYWANDELNDVRGFIPPDIDSRWVFNGFWANDYADPAAWLAFARGRGLGHAIDYAALHELVHHQCIGDVYVYNPGQFSVAERGGRHIEIRGVRFNTNDTMTGSQNAELSALSTLSGRWCNDHNDTMLRPSQYRPNEIGYRDPHNAFPGKLTLRIDYGSMASRVEGCRFAEASGAVETPVIDSALTATHAIDHCELSLDLSDQSVIDRIYPVSFLVLDVESSTGTVVPLPVVVQRMLLNLPLWAANEDHAAIDAALVGKLEDGAAAVADHIARRLSESAGSTDPVRIGDPYVEAERYDLWVDATDPARRNASIPGTTFLSIPIPESNSAAYWALHIP